jgi:hypothetical protein
MCKKTYMSTKDWILSPQKAISYVEAQSPMWPHLDVGPFKAAKIKQSHPGAPMGLVSLKEKLPESLLTLYHGRTKHEHHLLQARKRGLIRNFICQHPDF